MTERRRGASFERSSREIARARGFVTDALRTWGLAADATTFELMVSELVSNAIVHGSGTISVAVSCAEGALRLEVRDDGGGTSEPHMESKPVGGWGLHFVDELADSWGSQRQDGCTVVWAVKRISPYGSSTPRG